jgi:tetratricopeptide (TPR) repeat protein
MRRQAKSGRRPGLAPATTASAPPAAPARARRLPHAIAIAVLLATGVAAYWSSLDHPPVFDDRVLRADLLGYYATAPFQFDLRWLSYASFGWIHRIFGADWFWQRLANALLHGAVAAMLFTVVARLAEVTLPRHDAAAARNRPDPRHLAFFGALLFLLHPVAVYGVAYLVQRSIILATLFSLVSLTCFLEGLSRKSYGWHAGAAVAYFAAVFSKEHAVTLPAVALALAVLMRGGSRPPLRELAFPLALYAGIAALITLKVQGWLGAPYEPFAQSLLAQLQESRADPQAAGTYPLSVINQACLFLRYLLLWCIPYTGWMSVDLRTPFPASAWDWPYGAGIAAYIAYAIGACALLRRGGTAGVIGFGLLCPWLLALTEFAAVRIQEPFVLYRSYLWMGLPVAILPMLFARVAPRWAYTVLAAACIALVPPLLDRLGSFSTAVKLWEDAILKQRDTRSLLVERAWHNRGLALMDARRHPEALRDFNRALELNPADASAYAGRGTLRGRAGDYAAALADLDRAVDIDPRYAEAYAKRCFTKMMLGRPPDAVNDCERAIALDPRHRDAHTNLGVVYAALRRPADAEASYRRALAIDPGNGDANYNYGVLLVVTGRTSTARHYLGNACRARLAAACQLLSETGKTP